MLSYYTKFAQTFLFKFEKFPNYTNHIISLILLLSYTVQLQLVLATLLGIRKLIITTGMHHKILDYYWISPSHTDSILGLY